MCHTAYAHGTQGTQTHTEKFRTPSAIFNQEFDPSFHLGFLTWWAAVCTQEHMHT